MRSTSPLRMASGVSSTFGGTQLGERAVSNHAKNSLAGSEIHKHFKQLKDRHTKKHKNQDGHEKLAEFL